MDWDQLATVAQLVTGAATLAVAIFLAVQLRLQREDADRAHLDSVRNFDFGNEELLQDLVLTIVGDESTSELYWKAASRARRRPGTDSRSFLETALFQTPPSLYEPLARYRRAP